MYICKTIIFFYNNELLYSFWRKKYLFAITKSSDNQTNLSKLVDQSIQSNESKPKDTPIQSKWIFEQTKWTQQTLEHNSLTNQTLNQNNTAKFYTVVNLKSKNQTPWCSRTTFS